MFTSILKSQSFKPIMLQLIQTATMLIHNLQDISSVRYLANSSFYEEVLVHPFDFSDPDLIENYASLIKGISMNLPGDLLKDFLITKHFSLFNGSRTFLFYPETMVRTASRSATLKILSIKHKRVREYVLNSGYFLEAVCMFRQNLLNLSSELAGEISLSKAENLIHDQIDTVFYFNDIFNLDSYELSCHFGDLLLQIVVFPLVFGSMITQEQSPELSLQLASFLLIHFLDIIQNPFFVNAIAACLVLRKIQAELKDICLEETSSMDEKQPLNMMKVGESILSNEYRPDKNNPIRQCLVSMLSSENANEVNLAVLLCQSFLRNELISKQLVLESEFLNQETTGTLLVNMKKTESMCTSVYLSTVLALISKERDLTAEEVQEFKVIFLRAIERIQEHVAEFDDFVLDSFEEEWTEVSKMNIPDKNNSQVYFALSASATERYLNEIPLEFRGPVNEYEEIKSSVHRFLVYRKLFYLVTKNEDPYKLPINHCEWKEETTYYIGEKSTLKCTIKELREETRYLVEDERFFVLAELDLYRIYFAKVTHLCSLRNAEVMLDRSDPRTLVIAINKHSCPYQLVLGFDDAQTCLYLKRMVEDNKSVSKTQTMNELNTLLSFYKNIKFT